MQGVGAGQAFLGQHRCVEIQHLEHAAHNGSVGRCGARQVRHRGNGQIGGGGCVNAQSERFGCRVEQEDVLAVLDARNRSCPLAFRRPEGPGLSRVFMFAPR